MLLALALYASTAHAASPPDSVERRASSTRTRRTTTSSCWGVKARMARGENLPRPRVTLRRCGAAVKGPGYAAISLSPKPRNERRGASSLGGGSLTVRQPRHVLVAGQAQDPFRRRRGHRRNPHGRGPPPERARPAHRNRFDSPRDLPRHRRPQARRPPLARMRVTNGRSSGAIRRSTRRADSSHCEDTFTSKTSVPEWDRQFRLVRVHHEHREELGRLRLAGIGTDAVAVAGQLGEALSRLVGRHRSVVDLTADRPLKHGRVDEGGFGMRVARRVAARAVFDEHALDALAGNVRQLVLVDEGHLGVRRLRRIGEDAAERQGGDKQRTEDAFHGALSFGWRMQDQALACERRSHSSKPMRLRRASPNGTSERSSTRPPQYRAPGSRTTSRGSPTAFR